MNEAFLKAYERELGLLYDRGKEFAQDYPGIAGRLGGLLQGNLDPAVDGLMQGTAFLAARVQHEIDREFSTFTHELLEQLLPNFLAPTPSAMLVQANPDMSGPELIEGYRFAEGSYLDARYVERDQRVQCRYRLSAPLTLWPLRITEAALFSGPGRFQALDLDPLPDTSGGLQLTIERVAPSGKGAAAFDALPLDTLDIHLVGETSDAAGLFEAIFAHRVRASVRFADSHGDPVIVPLRPDQIEPVGFDDEEAFFAEDTRIFRGFVLVREFFMFPRKFMGFRLTGLGPIVRANGAGEMQLLIELDSVSSTLVPRVGLDDFGLFCVPALNLFAESANQVPLDVRRAEYPVVPSSSPSQNYEVHRITEVNAIYQDSADKVPVHRLYAAPATDRPPSEALYFSDRRRERVLTTAERRSGARRDYRGVETLISFYEPAGLDDDMRAARLQIRTLSSNRHLPMHLPIGQSGADFFLNDDTTIDLACVAGPSAPKPSVADAVRADAPEGRIPWRLMSFLALNFLGLSNRGEGGGAPGLREMLSIFVDLDSPVNEQQLMGIEKVETRPIVRSIKRGNRFHSARGIEVTVTFDERAFEASSVVLFSALLDRFFAEYAPVNSFTQVVAVSKQRGKLRTWPPRSGQGPIL